VPEVPVTVTVEVPGAAVLLAVNVRVLVLVAGFGLNDGVTPVGRPDAERFTLPVNPLVGVIVIVLLPLAPCATVAVEAERLKSRVATALTVRATVVV
jgi:hypothetical protein